MGMLVSWKLDGPWHTSIYWEWWYILGVFFEAPPPLLIEDESHIFVCLCIWSAQSAFSVWLVTFSLLIPRLRWTVLLAFFFLLDAASVIWLQRLHHSRCRHPLFWTSEGTFFPHLLGAIQWVHMGPSDSVRSLVCIGKPGICFSKA